MTNVGTYYSPCVDSHCWSVDNVNSWICRLRRICLIFFTKVETHFFLKCTIRKLGPLWADWNCHGNFLVANIGSRNVSEKRHEHSIVAIGIIYTGPIFSTFVISFFKLSSTKIYTYESNAKHDFFFNLCPMLIVYGKDVVVCKVHSMQITLQNKSSMLTYLG